MRFFVVIVCLIICSCSTQKNLIDVKDIPAIVPETEALEEINYQVPPTRQQLNCTFAGDIMAHNVNYNMKDYNIIYDDIRDLLQADDASFANLEVPVCNELPYETYPTFNIQSPYALAAIEAGFDVFSLANNHTNDQGLKGIQSTKSFFDSLKEDGVYSAGIKTDDSISTDASISYDIIKKKGWTILFAAYTEIINAPNDTAHFDFYPYAEQYQQKLKKQLIALQETYPHDIFVLSVHTAEPEYETSITDRRREWFLELLDAGIDIVWGNHPHVTQDWELYKADTGDKMIMYSVGNTISGQNYWPAYDDPLHKWEDTGTSVLIEVDITDKNKPESIEDEKEIGHIILNMEMTHTIIANHKDAHNNMLIKKLTPEFIEAQNTQNKAYYTIRLEDMQKIQGQVIMNSY